MRRSKRLLGAAVVAGLAMALAAPGALAMSLQDLADGSSITTGSGILLDDFVVKIRGGKNANKDLSSYLVTATQDGFDVDVSGAGIARLKLSYTASTGAAQGSTFSSQGAASVLGGLIGASATLGAQDPSVGKGILREKIKGGRKKLGLLKAALGGSDAELFDVQTALSIAEKIKLGKKKGAVHTANLVQHSFQSTVTVPEPSTAWLACAALAGLALRARRP